MVVSRTFKVLIAEDDLEDQMLTGDAFENEGKITIQVEFVLDGVELMQRLDEMALTPVEEEGGLPDLVIVDLKMPRMGGFEALQAIKLDKRIRMLPVIVMSVSNAPENIEEAFDQGASGFICKPVTYEELKEKLFDLAHYWTNVTMLPIRGKVAGSDHVVESRAILRNLARN